MTSASYWAMTVFAMGVGTDVGISAHQIIQVDNDPLCSVPSSGFPYKDRLPLQETRPHAHFLMCGAPSTGLLTVLAIPYAGNFWEVSDDSLRISFKRRLCHPRRPELRHRRGCPRAYASVNLTARIRGFCILILGVVNNIYGPSAEQPQPWCHSQPSYKRFVCESSIEAPGMVSRRPISHPFPS